MSHLTITTNTTKHVKIKRRQVLTEEFMYTIIRKSGIQHIRMITAGSCDAETGVMTAENLDLHHRSKIKLIWIKYMNIKVINWDHIL